MARSVQNKHLKKHFLGHEVAFWVMTKKKSKKFFSLFLGPPCRETPENARPTPSAHWPAGWQSGLWAGPLASTYTARGAGGQVQGGRVAGAVVTRTAHHARPTDWLRNLRPAPPATSPMSNCRVLSLPIHVARNATANNWLRHALIGAPSSPGGRLRRPSFPSQPQLRARI